jgi:hypothetical protein
MRYPLLAASAALVAVTGMIGATPAQAHENHASCKGYGQTVSEFAQTERPFGQLVSNAATQGFNDLLVRETHAMPEICEPRD